MDIFFAFQIKEESKPIQQQKNAAYSELTILQMVTTPIIESAKNYCSVADTLGVGEPSEKL